MTRDGSLVRINQAAIKLINRACCELWYRRHPDEHSRHRIRRHIGDVVRRLRDDAGSTGKDQIIILDNSFPSTAFRTVDRQWDLLEPAELVCPYAEMRLIGLYREPIAATFSHAEWDGGYAGMPR